MNTSVVSSMRLPIGCDDFGKILDNQLTFVDKSLLIRDILQDTAEVILITRPRRFGKTLNMSLLRYFFASEVRGRKTTGMFNHLHIAQYPECMVHQGQYPVISVTFKDLKFKTFEQFYEKVAQLMSELYAQHSHVLSGSEMQGIQKRDFEQIVNRQASEVGLKSALRKLTEYLHNYYQKKPIILIDEYDTPMLSAYQNHYYDEAVDLIRGLLSEGLKGNDDLEKAVLTGVLRVAKEGMFSGLNNIKVYSIFHPGYSEYFGFIQTEVDALLEASGFRDSRETLKHWYNGYQIGDSRLYNPWSIMCYLDGGGVCEAYWLNTSDNEWMQELLIRSNLTMKISLEQLLQGQAIDMKLHDRFMFSDLERDDATLWSLLVMAGYVTATRLKLDRVSDRISMLDAATHVCVLEIPNYEVRATYSQLILRWLSNDRISTWYDEFMAHLLSGEVVAWSKQLEEVVVQIVSYHDPVKYPEAFYHGLLLGILAYLHQTGYMIKSNRESGKGRYDIAIIPQDTRKLGILLELKHISSSSESLEIEAKLASSAKEALHQMSLKRYDTELRQAGIARICQIGLAFCGKQFQLQHVIRDYP